MRAIFCYTDFAKAAESNRMLLRENYMLQKVKKVYAEAEGPAPSAPEVLVLSARPFPTQRMTDSKPGKTDDTQRKLSATSDKRRKQIFMYLCNANKSF